MKNKTNIILGVIVIVLLYLYLSKPEVVKEVTKTIIKIDTITKTIDNTKPIQIKKVFFKTIDTVFERINDTLTIEKVVFKDKEVNQYKYIDSLENGIINATILADKIYKRDIKLKTFNKTTETTTTKTIVKSSLYFGGIVTLNTNQSLHNASLNVFYVYKDKWLITGGVGYSDVPNVSFGVGFKF